MGLVHNKMSNLKKTGRWVDSIVCGSFEGERKRQNYIWGKMDWMIDEWMENDDLGN